MVIIGSSLSSDELSNDKWELVYTYDPKDYGGVNNPDVWPFNKEFV
jgi:hypothetical protein